MLPAVKKKPGAGICRTPDPNALLKGPVATYQSLDNGRTEPSQDAHRPNEGVLPYAAQRQVFEAAF